MSSTILFFTLFIANLIGCVIRAKAGDNKVAIRFGLIAVVMLLATLEII